jgi:amino acid transporter
MQQLNKTIGVFTGIGIAVGMVVGSGLFGLPGLAIDLAGSTLSLYAWLATMLISIPMLHIFIKLGMRFPKAAGLSKYAEIAFGSWGGYGVTAVLSGTFTIGIPALAIIGGAYLTKLLSLGEYYTYIFAVLFLFISTFLNAFGVRAASWINTVSLSFIFLLIFLLLWLHPEYFVAGKEILFTHNFTFDIEKLWSVMALLFWAFLGWENLSFGLEEFKNPNKNIPLVYWGSFFIISLFYFMLAMLSSGATALGVVVSGTSAVSSLVGNNGFAGNLLVFFIVIVILANANSWVFGASRLIYSAGEQGILPTYLGRLNSKKIPVNSLISLFVFYLFFIALIWIYQIHISKIIMIVSQNFLVLYLASIIAYAKLFRKITDYIVLMMSGIVLAFFFQGFGFALVYPIVLLAIGYMVFQKHK